VGPLVAGAVVGLLYETFAYRALAYVGPLQETGITGGLSRKGDGRLTHRQRGGEGESSPAGEGAV
jgi:hypothetical protein